VSCFQPRLATFSPNMGRHPREPPALPLPGFHFCPVGSVYGADWMINRPGIVIRTLKAAAIYFLIVFAVGWVLGPIRELWVVPRFGRMTGLLLEAPLMLIAMIISARWVIRRFDVSKAFGTTISMGLIALGILAAAEIVSVLWGRGLSLQEYLGSLVTTSGVISLLMFLLFALMPTLVTRIGYSRVGAIS
jgi:hypothetical protein